MEISDNQLGILGKIHEFVYEECANRNLDDSVFTGHILGVRDFSMRLSDEYNADTFLVAVAAYLHDIHTIQTREHENHEIEGAKFARTYLTKYPISISDIELVSKCILNHRGAKDCVRASVEEKITACADAMDHISRHKEMFQRVLQTRSYDEALEFMRGKMQRGWKKLELDKAKELVMIEYNESRKLFNF